MCACGDSACASEHFRQSEKNAEIRSFFLTLLLIQLFIVPRLPVTFGGIVYMFAVYIRKLLPCFMLGSFLIATTSVSKFLAAVTKLRLSKGLTIALAVTLRYFPTMREEWAPYGMPWRCEGYQRPRLADQHPIQTMEHVYVPLSCSASDFGQRSRRQRLQEALSTLVKEAA